MKKKSEAPISLRANERLIWQFLTVFGTVTLAGCWLSDISFASVYVAALTIVVSLFLGTSLLYSSLRRDPYVALAARTCAQLVIALALCSAMIYPIATLSLPYRDADFHTIDRLLGFDWLAYLRLVNARPILSDLLEFAYLSIYLQFAVLAVVLCAQSNFARLQQYFLSTTIAAVLTLAIFAIVPAGGTYAYFNVAAADFQNLSPITTASQLDILDDLRSGELQHVSIIEGLITFPSFHSVWATLYIWGFFTAGRAIRLAAIVLNLFMLAATPLYGSHYLVDLIGGILVAGLSIWLAGLLLQQRSTTQGPSKSNDAIATQGESSSAI